MPPVLGLPDLILESIEHAENIYINALLKGRPSCPSCDSGHVRIKSSFLREINHSKHGNQVVIVRFKSHKYFCIGCKRYFNLKL